ncbi:uncharacterized transmembrane protein DDB_G0289901-like [Penaeus monodon]|uniref:uncharacterized transmembrane protein DDB_G0289901-like n=1 Tax=Penaeus monodon TaxID=6687 RepID=UPI0018A77AA3|nr:uncharacterized transmembrane protein DDB_G0289901-like [Penaeus monodon]
MDVTDQVTDQIGGLRPTNDPQQGYYGGGGQPGGQGGYGGGQGGYGGGQGGYGGGQGGYGGGQGGYGGGQGGYGGGQGGGGQGDMISGLIGGFLGGGGGGGHQQQQGGGGGGGGMNDLITGMASNYIGGMIGGQQRQQQPRSNDDNDWVANLTANVVKGIVSSNQRDANQPQAMVPSANNNDVVSSITSGIVQGLVRGQLMSSNTTQGNAVPKADDVTVANIASSVVKSLVESDDTDNRTGGNAVENLRTSGVDEELLAGIAGSVMAGLASNRNNDHQHGGVVGVAPPPPRDSIVASVTTNVLKGILSGKCGNVAQARKTGLTQDSVEAIASNVAKGLFSETENGSPYRDMSKKENEEVVRCVTSKIVNALVSQEEGTRADVSSDLLTKVASDAVSAYMSGGQNQNQYQGHGGQGGGGGGDLISGMASSVIGNLFSGDSGEATKQKTGLDDRMVAGIVSNVVRGIRGRPQLPQGEADGVNDDVVASVTSSVIKEIVSQDSEGKILSSNDPNVNSSIVSNIASKIVQNIMTSDSPEGEELKAAAREGGELEGGLIGGLVSDVIGGLIGGGGNRGGGGGGQSQDDVLSGIASNVIGGLVGGGGGSGGGGGQSSMSGGAIASNIIGKIVSDGDGKGGLADDLLRQIDVDGKGPAPGNNIRLPGGLPGGGLPLPGLPGQPGGPSGSIYRPIAKQVVESVVGNKLGQGVVGDVVKETSTDVLAEVMEGTMGPQFSRKEDGEVVENLTQSQVDPSKHRIFPDPGSLISSFMSKGAYHLRNRLMGGGRARAQRVDPAHAVFRVSRG